MSWPIVLLVIAVSAFVGWVIGVIVGGLHERKTARDAIDLYVTTGSINRLGIIRVRELVFAKMEHRPVGLGKKKGGDS